MQTPYGSIEHLCSLLVTGHMVDHVTGSEAALREHNSSIESIMIVTKKHNSMIIGA